MPAESSERRSAVKLLNDIHHVGVACTDISATRSWTLETHNVVADSGVVWDPLQRAHLCLLETNIGTIELVSGPVVARVVRGGPTPYHVCYEVDEIDFTVEALSARQCRPLSAPVRAVLFGGRRVVFMLGPTGLIELLETT